MTEMELERIEREISDAFPEEYSDVELAWIAEQIPVLVKQAGQLRAQFRLQKSLRQDERMQSIHADLIRLRAALDVLYKRQTELGEKQ